MNVSLNLYQQLAFCLKNVFLTDNSLNFKINIYIQFYFCFLCHTCILMYIYSLLDLSITMVKDFFHFSGNFITLLSFLNIFCSFLVKILCDCSFIIFKSSWSCIIILFMNAFALFRIVHASWLCKQFVKNNIVGTASYLTFSYTWNLGYLV